MSPDRLWAPWSLRDLVAERDAPAGSGTGSRTASDTALQRARSRTEEVDDRLHCWVERFDAGEQTAAEGVLAGVPIGVKDIIDVAGHPTRCGSALREDAEPAVSDAAIVSAWRRTGAVPVGKTVTTEFAYFSPGATRNPADPSHTPGGSSSGSAAAVASGQVPLALGSQTAGSVTRPAAYCGVASLVMTPGTVATDGVIGLSPSLDSHGFFTARADDLALAWSALTGDIDAASRERRPLRLLWWDGAEHVEVAPPMRRALLELREQLEDDGHRLEPLDARAVEGLGAAHGVVMAYEAARERRRELMSPGSISPQLGELLRRGADTDHDDYRAARAAIARARDEIVPLLERHDVIVGPAAPGPAPSGLGATGDPILSRPWQALGLPTAGVPGLRGDTGLPLGIQLVGAPARETDLLFAAVQVERSLLGGDADG